MINLIFVALLSYLCGSIPFGLILTKFFSKVDIRKVGSGNIGTTNVLRTGNKFLAFSTLILDVLKGFVPVAITIKIFPEFIYFSALIAFLAHLFPIWIKFKGGKGVATYLGVLLALSLPMGFLFIFTWITVFLIFRYSSLASIFSSLTVLVVSFLKDSVIRAIDPNITYVENIKLILFIFFILIIFTHRKNISNLKNRTEQKIKL